MNLPQPLHGSAMRPGSATSGSVLTSSSRSRFSACGVSVSAVMSASTPERSRTTPLASSRAGFSAPLAPYRISFMIVFREVEKSQAVGLEVDRVERTRRANVESVALGPAEADVGHRFRDEDFAE